MLTQVAVAPSSPSGVQAPPRANLQAPALPPRGSGPLPETGPIESVNPAQAEQLARLAKGLDSQDYFQVLQLPQSANASDIKRGFYRESRVYHPDRFFHLTDTQSKEHIGAIYRRITESYYVLRDDQKRAKYLAGITGPDRATKLRFSDASEAEQKAEAKKAVEDELSSNPKARQFFKTALADIGAANWSTAERNLKMGLTYDSANAKFKEKLAEVQRKLDEQRRLTGDTFRIK
jgi:DnaJ-class molecular chaperone